LRFVAILIVLYSLILARQNPFKPVIDETVLPITTNNVEKLPEFKKLYINLPNDARVLKSVTIFYQSIDGSIKKESVKVDKLIDWHKPIIVTQTKFKHKESVKKSSKNKPISTYKPLPFVKFQLFKKRIKIFTKDKKIRSFHLTTPFKVVIDLKRDAYFLTKKIFLDSPPFVNLNIGNHNGYYRVVVTFDSSYRYKILKVDDGYIIDVQ